MRIRARYRTIIVAGAALLALLAGAVGAGATDEPTDGGASAPEDGLVPAPPDKPQTPRVDMTTRVLEVTFPVAGPVDDLRFGPDDFTALRGGGSRLHAATDIMAPKHRAVHAAVGGTITFAPYPEPSYGWMVSIRGDDGNRYAYVHLNNDTPTRDADGRWLDDDAGGMQHAYAPRIVEAIRSGGSRGATGLRIERGELIGWLGDSGNAKGVASHLHFEIHLEDEWGEYRIPPYDSLRAAVDRGDVPVPGQPPADRASGDGAETVSQAPPATPEGFADVLTSNAHAATIARMAERGVVVGCTSERYCPNEAITRGDLAAALAAALELPGGARARLASTDYADVDADDPNSGAIAAVTDAGLLRGYGMATAEARRFGPDDPLTRGQLATVLVQGFELPAATGPMHFRDVPTDAVHGSAIAASHEAGLTRGCDDVPNYCGARDVTRGQIASFLDHALARP